MNDLVAAPAAAFSLSEKQLDLIQRTVAKDTNRDEFELFIAQATRARLDPLRRQITAIVFNKTDDKKRQMAVITTIDGMRAIAARSRNYRPMDTAPIYVTDPELVSPLNPEGIVSCEVRCFQKFDAEWFPVTGVAYWSEFAPVKDEWAKGEDNRNYKTGKKILDPTSPWFRMPRLMIAKTAEAQALRRGWPEDIGPLYTDDEMERSQVIDGAYEIVEKVREEERVARVGGDGLMFIFDTAAGLEKVTVGAAADRIMAYIQGVVELDELDWFEKANKESMRLFWSKAPGDALAVRQAMEEHAAKLRAANNP